MRICKYTRHLPGVRLMVRVVLRIWSRSRFVRHENNCTQGNSDEPPFHNDLLRFCDDDAARRSFAPLTINRVLQRRLAGGRTLDLAQVLAGSRNGVNRFVGLKEFN
jgi:hypothetical protein